jgi:hypothetical protein
MTDRFVTDDDMALDDERVAALRERDGRRPVNWAAAAVIVAVWIGLAALVVVYLARWFRR